jgi:hypothetical protein
MAGAALFGFLTGSGLFFVALILLALQTLYLGTIEVLARIHFNYRQRHPRIASASVAHKVRNTRIFWSTWASFMAFIAIYHWIWG